MENTQQNDQYSANNPASRLDAVRDLIFGQELQDLDGRLKALAQDIDQRDTAIHGDIRSLHEQMSKNIEQMQQNILARISEVQQAAEQELQRQNSAQISKKELGQILGSIAHQLDRA